MKRIVDGGNWFLIAGPDISNSDYGFTFGYGRDGNPWRYVWRVNIRWPVQMRLRRPMTVKRHRPVKV